MICAMAVVMFLYNENISKFQYDKMIIIINTDY